MREELFQAFVNASPVIPSEVEEPRGITSRYHRGILRLRFRAAQDDAGCGPTNPTAAEHNVTIVNYRSLSGRYRALRLVQSHLGAIIFQWRHCRSRSGMIVADLDRGFEALSGGVDAGFGFAAIVPRSSTPATGCQFTRSISNSSQTKSSASPTMTRFVAGSRSTT